jgi:DNA-directed RNA polymerase specialized sigma24 family protein
MHITEFEAELVPHAGALLRLARRLSRTDADDLVQETYVRALAARHRYTPGTNGRAWLMRTWFASATIAAHCGAPALVPPTAM